MILSLYLRSHRAIVLPRLFKKAIVESISDGHPHELRIDHCFNAVSNYNRAARLVEDDQSSCLLSIRMSSWGKVVTRSKWPLRHGASEREQHADGPDQLEKTCESEAGTLTPQKYMPQAYAEAKKTVKTFSIK